ncbi:hypothetical protein M9H77_24011 [Catharanthus roseus]|uniref:Uncharacterized protein n=1 Tax=Catharanthus roseus TaxID=4058 RepID=A0ACC0AZ26_CATRO|nr:hypothetical protein M9H77_24011 [Catharanthus roseus]
MDSEMRSLTELLHQISTGPISKVREILRLVKGVGFGFLWRGRPARAPKVRDRGRSCGRSCLSSVIDPSPCSTFPYTNAFPAFTYPFIKNWKNLIGDGDCSYWVVANFVFGDEHQWPELGSTTVLPLYSYSNRPGGILVIGPLTEQQHFIQFY